MRTTATVINTRSFIAKVAAMLVCALIAPNSFAQEENAQAAKEAGWAKAHAGAGLRFIRLDHGGMGWDDGMGKSGADANFLKHFAQVTSFNAAKKGESHPIADLAKYPANASPPFVFITGNGNLGRVSGKDMKVLREYCLKGGMLIGDAGSVSFDRTFRHLLRQVFPDKPLIDIADDDSLYQAPYHFAEGAPSFWHHGGRRPLGIKHAGRWICFYHPGDMNDAWKSKGYSDVTEEMKQQSLNLGVNLVFHAFKHQFEAAAKDQQADQAKPIE